MQLTDGASKLAVDEGEINLAVHFNSSSKPVAGVAIHDAQVFEHHLEGRERYKSKAMQ
jgi:hypothetical protein